MRTTIEITDDQRAQLLEIAGRRGEKGFSGLVREALDQYLKDQDTGNPVRTKALALKGTLDKQSAQDLAESVSDVRKKWR